MSELIEGLRKLSAENPSPRDCIDEAADELERQSFQLDCTEQALRDRTESARCGWAAATAADKDRERLTKQRDDLVDAAKELSRYFISGNCIPVDRAFIKADEFNRIFAEAIANAGGKDPAKRLV